MCRWLDLWGVGIASEKEMRKEARELTGDNLKAELAPFSFKHKDGGEVVKEAAIAYIPNLWMKISDLLDQNCDENKRYIYTLSKCVYTADHKSISYMTLYLYSINRVTWHNGAIPDDEVWLKLGGDKGGIDEVQIGQSQRSELG